MSDDASQDVAIFAAVFALPESERTAYLAKACGHDETLRARVGALLRAHDRAGDFLEQIPTRSGASSNSAPIIGEKPGDRVGRYKLLQQIGEGGCGVVFMAEQEEPVRRRVALKVVKPGMDSRSVIARFESERQALALMEHPNIAQVLDAGATDMGRPYFVMELVRGIKITDYCDQNSLTTNARLELFAEVCHAIQHAHQKGIIHRDIKPSNILVTTTAEGKPLPKVIDFGIAKATTGQRLTDKTLFTAFEMLIGTPAYMSPEQAALTSVDVDTRTDIYSLGVLLYELLTSTTPFDVRELLKSGLDEIRRVILNQDPIRPSTRLNTMQVADLTTVAQHRQVEALKLIRSVRGDLDWIVMKALEKDRTRRYPTANGLAMDVQHFLADEPVSARPPSAAYKLKKLVLRNKLLVSSLAVISALLMAGLGIVTVLLAREQQAHRDADLARTQAETEKRTAQAEASKSQQITFFLRDMLEGIAPEAAMGRDTTLLREILNRTAGRIATELTNQPAVEADLRFTLGVVYEELGDYPPSEQMFRRVLELNRQHLPEESLEVAITLSRLGRVMLHQMKLDEAERHTEASLTLWQRLRQEESEEAVIALETLAMVRWRQSRLPEAEAMMRRVHTLRLKLLPADHPDVVNALSNLGHTIFAAGRFAQAEQIYRQVLAALQQRYGAEHPSIATGLQNLATSLAEQGKVDAAREHSSRAVAMRRKLLGENHPNFTTSLDSLADVYRLSGNYADAAALYRESLKLELKRLDRHDPTVTRTLGYLVFVLAAQQKFAEVEALLADFLTPDFVQTPASVPALNVRLECFARSGRWNQAAADAARILQFQPDEHLHYHTLAPLLVADGNLGDYRKLCGEIMARFGQTKDMFVADRMAKDCLIHPLSGVDSAKVTALADLAVTAGKDQPALPFFQFCQALAQYRQGNFSAAAEWAQKSGQTPFPLVAVEANAVLAMAQHQLKQPELARASLAVATTTFETKLPKLETGDIGTDWRDWIIARALLVEARTLIEANPTQP